LKSWTKEFVVAQIGQPFGLEGFVKTKSFSGETAHLENLKEAVLQKNGSRKVYGIEKIQYSGGSLLVKFAGFDTPEAVKVLAGAEVIAGREYAAPLADGEFYIEDLKGLEVFFEKRKIGCITDILEGGGGNLAEIELVSGGVRLVPFRNEFFGEINLDDGKAELLADWVLD
jgi:16S rRNA processing protein RimM